MSVAARAASLLVAFLVVAGSGIFVALYFIGGASALPTVHYAASGGQVNVVLQEDAQNSVSSRPDWVSYYVQDPATKQWVHTTLFSVPANTRVNVTIYGYDGCTPLRNNYFSQVQGTIGNTVTSPSSTSTARSTSPNTPHRSSTGGRTATSGTRSRSRAMGVFVPVASPNAQLSANNLCSSSPASTDGNPYALEKFSFMSPDHGGVFRWQCLVPCGGGFLDGNSGPMQTLGYMMGEMDVVSS